MKTNYELSVGTEPEIDVRAFRRTALDIAYANQSPNQILDIFYPDEGDGPYPVVMVFHGGAFVSGHKRSKFIQSMCLPVTQGYAVVSVEYRYYTEAKWPAQLYDGKAALRYIRAHAEELNIDPKRIAVWGNSAGGMITQMMAVTGNHPEMDDLTLGEDASTEIQAAISWYCINEVISCEQFGFDIAEERARTGAGVGMMPGDGMQRDSMFTSLLGYNPLHYPEKAWRASPISFVNENCPPMFLEHGTNDMVVDYHQSVYMYERVRDICGDDRVILELFEGEPHGSPAIKAHENINRCIDFLNGLFFGGTNPYRKPLVDLKIVGED